MSLIGLMRLIGLMSLIGFMDISVAEQFVVVGHGTYA